MTRRSVPIFGGFRRGAVKIMLENAGRGLESMREITVRDVKFPRFSGAAVFPQLWDAKCRLFRFLKATVFERPVCVDDQTVVSLPVINRVGPVRHGARSVSVLSGASRSWRS